MFTLTNTGRDLLRFVKDIPSVKDFEVKRDGGRLVFYHYSRKPAFAIFTGTPDKPLSGAEALLALKMFLITNRLTK